MSVVSRLFSIDKTHEPMIIIKFGIYLVYISCILGIKKNIFSINETLAENVIGKKNPKFKFNQNLL